MNRVSLPPTAEEQIRKLLSQRDLSFDEFMRLAIYEPAAGYYSGRRDPVGHEGDFVTSPWLSPVFSFAISRLVAEFVRRSTDGVCSVVDIGCGDGRLIREICDLTSSDHPGVRYFGIDQSLARVGEQPGPPLEFSTSLLAVPRSSPALVLSNELFDALPFGRLVQRGDELHELTVTLAGDGSLQWSERPADDRYAAYFGSRGIALDDGRFADVSLEWETLYSGVVVHFERALFVTFDYGHEQRALFSGRARRYGTAVAYSKQQATRDLLANPGEQDLTAHINFTDLIRAGELAGCATLVLQSQAMMLLELGVTDHPLLQMLGDEPLESPEAALEMLAAREAAKRLILPDGPGLDVRVLVQSRGLAPDSWSFQRAGMLL